LFFLFQKIDVFFGRSIVILMDMQEKFGGISLNLRMRVELFAGRSTVILRQLTVRPPIIVGMGI